METPRKRNVRKPPVVSGTKICGQCKEPNKAYYPNRGVCAGCFSKNNKVKRDAQKVEQEHETAKALGCESVKDEEFSIMLSDMKKEVYDIVTELHDDNALLRKENQDLRDRLQSQQEAVDVVIRKLNLDTDLSTQVATIISKNAVEFEKFKMDIKELRSRFESISSNDLEKELSNMLNKHVTILDNNHGFLRSRVDDLNDKMLKLLRKVENIESKDAHAQGFYNVIVDTSKSSPKSPRKSKKTDDKDKKQIG